MTPKNSEVDVASICPRTLRVPLRHRRPPELVVRSRIQICSSARLAARLGLCTPRAVVSCRYEIRGGLLALQAGGSVTLAQRPVGAEHELSVTVEEYLPRLAGTLYAKGQSPFHAAVSRRYFEFLTRREGA
jgi:hypothetical protein